MILLTLLHVAIATVGSASVAPEIRINHLGYEAAGPKTIVVLSNTASAGDSFQVLDTLGNPAFSGKLSTSQTVPGWKNGPWRVGDFSALTAPGTYKIKLVPSGLESDPFGIDSGRLLATAGPAVVGFFNGMRNTDAGDRKMTYFGETARGERDVYGGWWDATGDAGKYLSHLSYANFMNPQQIPMVVWSLLRSQTLAPRATAGFRKQAHEEAAWGADYLLRVQDPAGYFYINVFDRWGGDPRKICAWTGNASGQGAMTSDYQAAWREGGGMSIAALALAARTGISGDSSSAQYLAGAIRGWEHLSQKSARWADDGKENLIDHYCALLAAIELYLATSEPSYMQAASARADSIVFRQRPEGWFVSDGGARPFFHGADEGLPLVALWAYLTVDGGSPTATRVRQCLARSVDWYHSLSRGTANPFLYPKMYVPLAPVSGPSGSGNIAKGKKAFATSVEGSGKEPEKAVDGVDGGSSRWASVIERDKPIDGSRHALVVDLADRFLIQSISVSWEVAKAVKFTVYAAVDTANWIPVETIVDSSNSTLNKIVVQDSLWARWVKISCERRVKVDWGYSIQELTVVGQKKAEPVQVVPAKLAFFMPHKNETDYWWQGENARLGSMAAGLLLARQATDPSWRFGADSFSQEAVAPLDWVAGKNSEGINFVYGVEGGTYASYFAGKGKNVVGGICNGITAISDTDLTPVFHNDGGADNWRWVEQWLPHDSWFLMGVAVVRHVQEFPEGSEVKPTVRRRLEFQVRQGAGWLDVQSPVGGTWTLRSPDGRVVARAQGTTAKFQPGRGLWLVQYAGSEGIVARSVVVP
ncbi:MAG TPA: glycoside hydrolase family 9 protein [Fibrobacteria bacterium]|nr:glycoside hydrolase family 9 protein [Fibrobacteria bacterium]